MNSLTKINEIIERIVAFCLIKGVQPDELVNAIFDDPYESIETFKKSEKVFTIVTYKECVDDEEITVKMKYTYSSKKQLQKVEQKINSGVYKTQWDRQKNLDSMVRELSDYMDGNRETHSYILSQIPEELRGMILPKLKIAC